MSVLLGKTVYILLYYQGNEQARIKRDGVNHQLISP